jgi:hypothetical protein|nr:MAG TPA: hypothetical protein [Caudoviricetes sp.]
MRKSRAKNRGRKGNSILIVLLQTFGELLATFKYGLMEELDKIAVVLQILMPIVIARTDLSTPKMLLVSCVLVVCVKYIQEVGYKLNHVTERGFPIPLQRFTDRDENGFISIKEEETQEAMLYLCDVEDYLKSKGWL